MKNRTLSQIAFGLGMVVLLAACKKPGRPDLGDFPRDSNPPGGPLNFYAAFDGTSTNPLMNAVDSIRASFPGSNPLTFVDGIRGKAVKGENKKFLKYAKPNDWAEKAESFTISFWYKKDGQTKNNMGGNGPEYIMSFKAPKDHHWSNATTLVFLEGNNAACAVKVMMVDKNKADNWFTWENAQMIPGLVDNNWHHMALVYNAAHSSMTLFVDGVANPNVKTWGTHGPINLDNAMITEFRVGNGPNNGPNDDFNTDDWLASSFKGTLDQFRLYSKALTVAEVQTLFTGKL